MNRAANFTFEGAQAMVRSLSLACSDAGYVFSAQHHGPYGVILATQGETTQILVNTHDVDSFALRVNHGTKEPSVADVVEHWLQGSQRTFANGVAGLDYPAFWAMPEDPRFPEPAMWWALYRLWTFAIVVHRKDALLHWESHGLYSDADGKIQVLDSAGGGVPMDERFTMIDGVLMGVRTNVDAFWTRKAGEVDKEIERAWEGRMRQGALR